MLEHCLWFPERASSSPTHDWQKRAKIVGGLMDGCGEERYVNIRRTRFEEIELNSWKQSNDISRQSQISVNRFFLSFFAKTVSQTIKSDWCLMKPLRSSANFLISARSENELLDSMLGLFTASHNPLLAERGSEKKDFSRKRWISNGSEDREGKCYAKWWSITS